MRGQAGDFLASCAAVGALLGLALAEATGVSWLVLAGTVAGAIIGVILYRQGGRDG